MSTGGLSLLTPKPEPLAWNEQEMVLRKGEVPPWMEPILVDSNWGTLYRVKSGEQRD
jgi:hypothetical protein